MLRSLLAALSRFLNGRATPAGRGTVSFATNAIAHEPHGDLRHVHELIGKVTELTATVAQDVGKHNSSIEEISTELTAVAQTDPTAVATIVCKLLLANKELQDRLERAEK